MLLEVLIVFCIRFCICLFLHLVSKRSGENLQVGKLQNFFKAWLFVQTELTSFLSVHHLCRVKMSELNGSWRFLLWGHYPSKFFVLSASDNGFAPVMGWPRLVGSWRTICFRF